MSSQEQRQEEKTSKTLVEQAVLAVHWDPSLRHAQSHEYGMTMPIAFAQVHVVAFYTSVFAFYTSVFLGYFFEVST